MMDATDVFDSILDVVIKSDKAIVDEIVGAYQYLLLPSTTYTDCMNRISEACRQDKEWTKEICEVADSPEANRNITRFLTQHQKYYSSHWTQIKARNEMMQGCVLLRMPGLVFENGEESL